MPNEYYNKLFLLILFCSVIGCGISKQVATEFNEYANAPTWVLKPSMEGGTCGVGSSKIGKPGFNFARTEAIAIARDEIARQIDIKTNNMIDRFKKKIGIGDDETFDSVSKQVSRQICSQNLHGSRHIDTWISPNNEIFVLVVLDHSIDLNSKIKDTTVSSFKNKNSLWQEFQAKKAFDQLYKEVDKEFGD